MILLCTIYALFFLPSLPFLILSLLLQQTFFPEFSDRIRNPIHFNIFLLHFHRDVHKKATCIVQQSTIGNNIIISNMKHMQNELIEQQDQHLDQINEIAQRLKKQGQVMNKEIDQQGKYIGQLNTEIDTTTQKLNFVQAKLGKLLKTNDMGQICTILILFVILIIMIFLVIYT